MEIRNTCHGYNKHLCDQPVPVSGAIGNMGYHPPSGYFTGK
jgi:hypothetical protein